MNVPKIPHRESWMLCVDSLGDQFQLTMRGSHGRSVTFPLLTKKQIVKYWLKEMFTAEERNIFNTAVLRMIPEYITQKEINYYKKQIFK
ncbi:hypothetical protein ABE82_26655 (plasmid) [Paenibacillus peoriae]|nr:hypothetical protein RE92_25105 [Paenibacillus polymyxa]ALS09994.1 hypothetical protein ABE82_26655 [Paenibacillus peoriae]